MFRKTTIGLAGIIIWMLLVMQPVALFTSCANIVPPVGGPKDSLPPVIVKMQPTANAVNVNSNKIVLEFNEYLQQFDNGAGLLISPLPVKPAEVQVKLRTVSVKLRDTLEPNTTYTIDFGNGIRDANEGNVYKNLKYVFSTGSYIDSLHLSGRVILAETGKMDTTLLVCLYRNLDDSAVVKQTPRYYAKQNGNGQFRFTNLPAGKFNIYALQDEGGQKKYLSEVQVFAFNNEPVTALAEDKETITLYAYAGKQEEPKAAPVAAGETRLRVQSSLETGPQDILESLVFEFNRPLKTIDTNKIKFTDTLNQKLSGYEVVIDSNRKKITLQYKWKPGTDYRIIVQKDFAVDEKGNTLPRGDTIKFRTRALKDYGKVKIRLGAALLPAHPVLQIVQGGKILQSIKVVGKQVVIDLFKPGEYDLRMLDDENGNGFWDAGTFFVRKKQPEKVKVLSKKLNVRADWDNELDIEQ
jgi:hypothetical protein